jgi:hypothetical protein
MTKRTEWLELPDAIEFVGPLIFPEWTGCERHAPTPEQVNAEIIRLHELTPEQLDAEYASCQAGIEADANGKRATSEAAGVKPSGIREGLEKLRGELAAETNKLAVETNELEAEKIEVRRRALQKDDRKPFRRTGQAKRAASKADRVCAQSARNRLAGRAH